MNGTRNRRNYENLERRIFEGVGEYGIPQLELHTFMAIVSLSVSIMPPEQNKTDSARRYVMGGRGASGGAHAGEKPKWIWIVAEIILYALLMKTVFGCVYDDIYTDVEEQIRCESIIQ